MSRAAARGGRPLRTAGALLAALLLAGCFEEPVSEELELRFPTATEVEVTATVTLRVPEGEDGNARLLARLDALERDLMSGATPWSRRFGALEPAREGEAWQREGPRLQWFRQWAAADPARLADFFADTPVQVFHRHREGEAEVSFFPGPGSRATAAETQRVAAAMAGWTAAVAAYEAAGFRLWRYLAAHPERHRTCIGHLFAFDLAEGESDALEPLRPTEEALLEKLSDGMNTITDVLKVPPDERETLEELARRVYDPYPARLRVVVAGKVLATEGLVPDGDGWKVPQRSPWNAFVALEGRWLAPDPLLARVAHARGPRGRDFDLDAFLAEPFGLAAEAPDAGAVEAAITAALKPAGARVVWVPEGKPPGG